VAKLTDFANQHWFNRGNVVSRQSAAALAPQALLRQSNPRLLRSINDGVDSAAPGVVGCHFQDLS
jgi:hypothetical protein